MLSIFCLSVGLLISGALASFIYATSLGFYKSPSRLLLRVALLGLLHIESSPYWAEPGILIMGTRRVCPCEAALASASVPMWTILMSNSPIPSKGGARGGCMCTKKALIQ